MFGYFIYFLRYEIYKIIFSMILFIISKIGIAEGIDFLLLSLITRTTYFYAEFSIYLITKPYSEICVIVFPHETMSNLYLGIII